MCIRDSADCATNMAVGDRITGTATLDASLFTVSGIGTGADGKKFTVADSAGNPVSINVDDGTTLTFSSKVNRSLTTVLAFPVTATDFTMSQAIQFRDNQPLTFTPRMNFGWPIDNYANLLKPGMIIVGLPDTTIGVYEDIVTLFAGTRDEKKIIKNKAPALSTLGKKPTVVKGLVTVQEGRVVFTNQLDFSTYTGQTLKIGGYGESAVSYTHLTLPTKA